MHTSLLDCVVASAALPARAAVVTVPDQHLESLQLCNADPGRDSGKRLNQESLTEGTACTQEHPYDPGLGCEAL